MQKSACLSGLFFSGLCWSSVLCPDPCKVFLEVVLLRVSHTDFLFTRLIASGYAKLQSLSALPIYIITDISLSPGTAETKPVCLIRGRLHPERVYLELPVQHSSVFCLWVAQCVTTIWSAVLARLSSETISLLCRIIMMRDPLKPLQWFNPVLWHNNLSFCKFCCCHWIYVSTIRGIFYTWLFFPSSFVLRV